MIIVKFIEDRLFPIGDAPRISWYVCDSNDDAIKYINEEIGKINAYNKDEDMVSSHRTGSYTILTPEQVKELSLYEVDTLSIGMLFKIMSYN